MRLRNGLVAAALLIENAVAGRGRRPGALHRRYIWRQSGYGNHQGLYGPADRALSGP